MLFFSKTGIPDAFLEEIWERADQEQKDYITEMEFYIALKLIACAQNGSEANDDILSTLVPVPHFKDITVGSKSAGEIAPITAQERDAYIGIFHSCNPIDGLLYGEQAIEIFNRSGLPSEKLADIWTLADTRNSGTLNKTEFIIAMHYISRLMKDPTVVLPPKLPSQVYAEATGRFASSIRRHHTTTIASRSRASSNASMAGYTSPVISHMMSGPTATASTVNSTSIAGDIALAAQEKEKYSAYFQQLDTDGSGFIDADEAVYFFSHSRLPNSELGRIWEIADSRRLGKLDLHDFCIAMHLINMCKRGESIDKYDHAPLTPDISNQTLQSQANLNQRYELENQLIELKQQINHEAKRLSQSQAQYRQEQECIEQLNNEIAALKSELSAAKQSAEVAERLLNVEQKKNRELTGISSLESSYSSAEQRFDSPLTSNLPELTRTTSIFSGSSNSVVSPRSDYTTTLDPFAGFKRMNQGLNNQAKLPPVSPTQSKAIAKYGFDITVFDALSIEDDTSNKASQPNHSIKDDLAALFGSPTVSSTTTTASDNHPNTTATTFDSIFL
ncbi:Ubiquitin-conjugating enzyme E2 4 [Mucor velutinosus]|uniref:Ubiquitin-conjugating enzyme E2 4 n=1 Tax=Mucor velutinosus TaxID=708070 RepID=A0AAN7HYK1_9FUNG|nr:Ubiquitin-conjugating enzyme E2 4 [Mucor velutinosus]